MVDVNRYLLPCEANLYFFRSTVKVPYQLHFQSLLSCCLIVFIAFPLVFVIVSCHFVIVSVVGGGKRKDDLGSYTNNATLGLAPKEFTLFQTVLSQRVFPKSTHAQVGTQMNTGTVIERSLTSFI